jgi:beta-xylosidase
MRPNRIQDLFILGGLIIFTLTGCYRDKQCQDISKAVSLRTGNNPVIDEGSADPSVRVFGDRVYVYPSHDYSRDNDFWIMKDWKVYSTNDLVNFTDHGIILEGKNVAWAVNPDHCWAPDCIQKNGRYYFYFPMSDKEGIWKGKIGVGVSDSPAGPFRDALGCPLIEDGDKPPEYAGGYYNIDPAVFTDEDDRSYLFWGNGACFMAELNEDMVSLKSEIINISIENHLGYREGPFVWKRKGIYYLLYSRTGSSSFDVLDYATSTGIQGPYQYRGTIVGHGRKGNEHGSVFQFNGQWYVAYHDLYPTDKYRKTCLEIIHYRDNGDIFRVYPTRTGVGWYNASEPVEAENYFEKSADVEYRENEETGFHLHHLVNGSWVRFPNVKFDYDYRNRFSAHVASGSRGGVIEVLLDSLSGVKAGELVFVNTGGWDKWQTMDTTLAPFRGTRDIILRFKGQEHELFSLDWIRFE